MHYIIESFINSCLPIENLSDHISMYMKNDIVDSWRTTLMDLYQDKEIIISNPNGDEYKLSDIFINLSIIMNNNNYISESNEPKEYIKRFIKKNLSNCMVDENSLYISDIGATIEYSINPIDGQVETYSVNGSISSNSGMYINLIFDILYVSQNESYFIRDNNYTIKELSKANLLEVVLSKI